MDHSKKPDEHEMTMGETAGKYIDKAHDAAIDAKNSLVENYTGAVEKGTEMMDDSGTWISGKYEGRVNKAIH